MLELGLDMVKVLGIIKQDFFLIFLFIVDHHVKIGYF